MPAYLAHIDKICIHEDMKGRCKEIATHEIRYSRRDIVGRYRLKHAKERIKELNELYS